jgi:hypothetical protein
MELSMVFKFLGIYCNRVVFLVVQNSHNHCVSSAGHQCHGSDHCQVDRRCDVITSSYIEKAICTNIAASAVAGKRIGQ